MPFKICLLGSILVATLVGTTHPGVHKTSQYRVKIGHNTTSLVRKRKKKMIHKGVRVCVHTVCARVHVFVYVLLLHKTCLICFYTALSINVCIAGTAFRNINAFRSRLNM